MRIGHVTGTLDPAAGGPPMVVSRLASAQAALGHEVFVLCHARRAELDEVKQKLGAIPGFAKVQVRGLGAPRQTAGVCPCAIASTSRWIRNQHLDIVHLHGVWEPLLRLSARLAAHAHVPYVVAPHGMLDPWSLHQSRWKKQLALHLGYGRMLRAAAFLHVLNADEQALLPTRWTPEHCVTLPNGIFLDEVQPLPPAAAFRARVPALGGKPYILFLSRLHYKKGLDRLAGAFALLAHDLPDVHLVVAGPDGGAEQDFRQQVQQAGLEARVHLVGPLWGEDKLAALAGAACFCLPSRQEGFSMAITEALACGRPVVISAACHFPQVAEAQAGVVVDLDDADVPGSHTRLAEALRQVLTNSARAADMGQAGMTLVREHYTWPIIAQQSISAYQQVLAA